ncbi:hypothetical protein AVEN_103540-1 [Araneus ventricosus]|uniref:Uncharacterized protein n=1 Tax=Araneus ventricosus TaxID=182803 RepID=A0A4Y2JNC5_ARAVE|nr:hypothetical protein AVEN_103540-1 [Araneus ventricosus]
MAAGAKALTRGHPRTGISHNGRAPSHDPTPCKVEHPPSRSVKTARPFCVPNNFGFDFPNSLLFFSALSVFHMPVVSITVADNTRARAIRLKRPDVPVFDLLFRFSTYGPGFRLIVPVFDLWSRFSTYCPGLTLSSPKARVFWVESQKLLPLLRKEKPEQELRLKAPYITLVIAVISVNIHGPSVDVGLPLVIAVISVNIQEPSVDVGLPAPFLRQKHIDGTLLFLAIH